MAFFKHNSSMQIVNIPADIQNDITECVQNVKHSGTEDGIKAATRLEVFLNEYKASEQRELEEIKNFLTEYDAK